MTVAMNETQKEQVNTSKIWQGVLVGGLASVVANLIVYFIFQAIGLDIQIPQTPGGTDLAPLPIGPVIGASFIPAIGAGVLLFVLGKWGEKVNIKRPFTVFYIISVAFLLLSFGGPFGLPGALGAKIALNFMHVVAGVVIVGGLVWATKES